jgi:8-oxo-dGTP diphosphatase
MPPYLEWLRAHVGHHLIPLVYATALVRDDAGRILFQQRADFRAWWGLPGGLLEPGETPTGCLEREVAEETGLRVEPLGLTGVYSSPRYTVTYPMRLLAVYAGYEVTLSNGDRLFPVAHLFACRWVGGRPQADGHESLEVGFFAPAELPPLIPPIRQRVRVALGLEDAPLV